MIQCPQCGQLNEPFFKFCLMCGAPLEGAATVSRGPTRSERPAKPEAKTPARAPVGGSPSLGKPAPAATPAEAAPAAVVAAPVEAAPVEPEPVAAAPVEPEPVAAAPVEPEPVAAAPVEPEPVAAAPVEPAPVEPVSIASDETFDDDEELGARDMPAPARTATPVPAPAPEPEPVPEPSMAPAPAPEPAAPSGGKVRRRTRFTLVVIREDMSDGERFALDEGIFTVGREGTSVEFPEDVYLDPFHASLDVTERGVTVVDQGSVNGTFWRIDAPMVLEHGHEVRLGQQLLRLELLSEVEALSPSYDGTELLGGPVLPTTWGRLVEVVAPDFDGDAHLLDKTPIAIGREKGDITFPSDGYVSGRHARLTWDGTKARIEDLGSSNGTFARAYSPTALGVGSRVLLGQQLFRIDG